MPIYISGKTLCPLCGHPVYREQSRVGFPSFLKPTHGLSRLSDAVAHQSCFDQWEYREPFLILFEKFQRLVDRRPQGLDWKDGEVWLQGRGEEFDREAEALDPLKNTA